MATTTDNHVNRTKQEKSTAIQYRRFEIVELAVHARRTKYKRDIIPLFIFLCLLQMPWTCHVT